MAKTMTRKAAVAHGALIAFFTPRLANDAAINLTPVLSGVTAKNYATRVPGIVTKLTTLAKDKLAEDADLDGLKELLDGVGKMKIAEDEMTPSAGGPVKLKVSGMDDVKAFLKDKLSAEDMAACDAMMDDDDNSQEAMDEDETEEERKKREAKAEDEDDEDDDKKKKDKAEDEDEDDKDKKMDKKAMDAAIKKSVTLAQDEMRQNMRDVRKAEDAIAPYVGKLGTAYDTGAEVLRAALRIMKIPNVEKMHSDALMPVLLAQPVPNSKTEFKAPIAMDAAAVTSFTELYGKTPDVRQL